MHLVASLLKRWVRDTQQGAVSQSQPDYYLDEFTFCFNPPPSPPSRTAVLPPGRGRAGRRTAALQDAHQSVREITLDLPRIGGAKWIANSAETSLPHRSTSRAIALALNHAWSAANATTFTDLLRGGLGRGSGHSRGQSMRVWLDSLGASVGDG